MTEFEEIKTNLQTLNDKVDYQNKLLETLINTASDRSHNMEQNKKNINQHITQLVQTFTNHPAFKNNPAQLEVLKNLTTILK